MIGHYQLVERIAEGGTGEVFRAYNTKDGSWCAVKRLLPDLAKKTALRKRFEREGQTMMHLEHPNIAKVYDVGTDEENAFLVMDYAEAGSVADWLERNHQAMPPKMAVKLTLEVCRGIQYAHEQGVIHRDIKPQNLLLGRDGVCRISDFGIAMVAASHTRMTLTGTVMGTLGYVAPEQYESAKHTDARADVYSIVATLYTLVHGEAANHLFMADDSDYAGIPKELAAIIRKGAQYQRDMRHQTVQELANELNALLHKLPSDPPSTPPLVPATLESYSQSAPLQPVKAEESPKPVVRRRSPSPLARRVTSDDAVPVDNRTPSSIIPRNSLTSESTINRRLRRPKLRNRDEIERQVRLTWVARFAAVMVLVVLFTSFMIAGAGKFTVEAAERREAEAEAGFVEKLNEQAQLWESRSENPHLTRGKEIRAVFEQLANETDPTSRGALVGRLSTIFQQEIRDLDQRGEAAAGIKLQIEQDDEWLKKWRGVYETAVEERIAAESSPLGWIGSSFFFFID